MKTDPEHEALREALDREVFRIASQTYPCVICSKALPLYGNAEANLEHEIACYRHHWLGESGLVAACMATIQIADSRREKTL